MVHVHLGAMHAVIHHLAAVATAAGLSQQKLLAKRFARPLCDLGGSRHLGSQAVNTGEKSTKRRIRHGTPKDSYESWWPFDTLIPGTTYTYRNISYTALYYIYRYLHERIHPRNTTVGLTFTFCRVYLTMHSLAPRPLSRKIPSFLDVYWPSRGQQS